MNNLEKQVTRRRFLQGAAGIALAASPFGAPLVVAQPARLKVGLLETASYMRNQLLRDTDWASMAHSLEVRVPLVDVELFRTVTRLIHAGFAPCKQDMAASPSTPLPQSVLHRHKTGFSVPVREWLTAAQASSSSPGLGLRKWATFVYQRQNSGKIGSLL